MPDITMCVRTDCPRAKNCGRSEESGTKPDKYQSWGEFSYCKEDSGFMDMIPPKGKEKL